MIALLMAAAVLGQAYPMDCAQGAVNQITLNYPHGDAPAGSCPVLLAVSKANPAWPAGREPLGELGGLNDSAAGLVVIWGVMEKAAYCGVVTPAHDWEDLGRITPGGQVEVEAVRLAPCSGWTLEGWRERRREAWRKHEQEKR